VSGQEATAARRDGALQGRPGTSSHKSDLARKSSKAHKMVSPLSLDLGNPSQQLSSLGGSQGQPLHVSSTVDGLTRISIPQTGPQEAHTTYLGATLPAETHRKGLESKFLPERRIESLEDALAEMFAHDVPFLTKYLVMGAVDRRQGGQGLVQFLRGKHDAANYAVKVCDLCSEFPAWDYMLHQGLANRHIYTSLL
jgi:hypothetical protein